MPQVEIVNMPDKSGKHKEGEPRNEIAPAEDKSSEPEEGKDDTDE